MISATTQGVGKTIIPVPAGNQLSACTHADHPPGGQPALTCAPKVSFRAKRSGENIKCVSKRKRFFKEFLAGKMTRKPDFTVPYDIMFNSAPVGNVSCRQPIARPETAQSAKGRAPVTAICPAPIKSKLFLRDFRGLVLDFDAHDRGNLVRCGLWQIEGHAGV